MAQEIPEENIARLLIDRYDLKFPLDIRTFAASHAEVKEESLPDGIDGLILHAQGFSSIFLEKEQFVPRKNFTLAHELGHLFIPWHPQQNFVCSPEEVSETIYYQLEKEANRFSGELLAPRQWLQSLERTEGIKKALKILVSDDYLSTHAACLNLANKSKSTICITTTNETYNTKEEYLSPNALKLSGHGLITNKYDMASQIDKFNIRSTIVEIFHFNTPKKQFKVKSSEEPKVLLSKILNDIPQENTAKIQASIHGTISGLNSTGKVQSPDELFHLSIERFHSRPDLKAVAQHPLFDEFVAQRCKQFFK